MIIDDLEQASKYYTVHPRFQRAFEYLINTDLDKVATGKYEIDAENIFAIIVNESGVPMLESTSQFECHNTYIDIQYVFSGEETIGWKSRSSCVDSRGDYDQQKDVLFYEDAPDFFFKLHPGQFGVYFPDDVHAPMIGSGNIRKVVIKVKK
jgi:biofilm protein TabA